jgi:lysophospholipase L1-like esterase
VDPAKGVTAGGTRILCVGGSVTRGAPFEEDGGVPSFPDLLEARLHGDGRRDATVFNRGVDAAGIGYIADHLPENLEQFRPTHLVVTAVANDFYRQPADYAVDVNRVLTQAKDFGVKQILLVKELEVDLVYGTARQNRSLYAVLDQAAARHGVTIVDPRPDFQAHRNEFLFMDWVHFTVRGNSLMADVIARQIDFD